MENEVNNLNGADEVVGGWRLQRLEMANWGTFGDGVVHVVTPESGWTLLVGQNGSGKSTTIDALRTLLAPRTALRHSFNDAAGGQKKQDRSLNSYIRGAWSASRDEESGDAETKFLRKEETHSYLLAVFRNLRLGTTLTLAQILWVANGRDETLYLLADGEKKIVSDLAGLERGRTLKKELQSRGFDVRDSYRSYREDFSARMGIPGEGALEIFNQAIGIKEVSDVGLFLRKHLLSEGNISEFLRERVIPQFHDLESCWNDIVKAKDQITLLRPVAAHYAKTLELEARRKIIVDLLAQLEGYYLEKEKSLVRRHLEHCNDEIRASNSQIVVFDERRAVYQEERDELKDQLRSLEVTGRLSEIDRALKEAGRRRDELKAVHDQLFQILLRESLGPVPDSDDAFAVLKQAVRERIEKASREEIEADRVANEAGIKKAEVEGEIKGIEENIRALFGKRALIPARLQYQREKICEATGLDANDLPFAGELMEVRPEYADEWGGAIEKLLHNFGVSLLIPERHYQQVVHWINASRLTDASGSGVRLVFHAVPPGRSSSSIIDDHRRISGRLNFRDEHPVASWVGEEVRRAFSHVCCRDTVELERESFGLTKEGTIRNRSAHIKDDRRPIGARSEYVLGWSPERKIEALQKELVDKVAARGEWEEIGKKKRKEARDHGHRQALLEEVGKLGGYSAIDFESEQKEIVRLEEQRLELEESSERFKTLQAQCKGVEEQLTKLGLERDKIVARSGHWGNEVKKWTAALEDLEKKVDDVLPLSADVFEEAFGEYEDGVLATHENVGVIRFNVSAKLSGKANQLKGEINKVQKDMIAPMQTFIHDYEEDATDLRATSDYAPDFVRIHDRLVAEDLPQHEERFRDFLNTNLTENIGGLEDKLNAEVKAHRARIDQVNVALAGLEYSPGTYVEIERSDTRDVVIRNFKVQLRSCLSAGLQPNEDERLGLFKKIQAIVAHFKEDRDWANKVTDTRLWLDFGVSEKQQGTDKKIHYYGSSVGKSGGQKAKLAFTILSASLLAQYGLADFPDRDDSLRLVVVDEVFARTDEANSLRALELFKKMGFQLLLAAPWKAEARIAESYVATYHLTTINAEENASRVSRISEAVYEAKRKEALEES